MGPSFSKLTQDLMSTLKACLGDERTTQREVVCPDTGLFEYVGIDGFLTTPACLSSTKAVLR